MQPYAPIWLDKATVCVCIMDALWLHYGCIMHPYFDIMGADVLGFTRSPHIAEQIESIVADNFR